MIARLIVLVSLMEFLNLAFGEARALDLVNVVLAPMPPFVIEGGTLGSPPGIVSEIITEAYRRDGKRPYYAYMPAARAEHTVRNGRAMATVVSTEHGHDVERAFAMPLSFTNGESASTRHPTRCTVMFLTSTGAAYGTARGCVKDAQPDWAE